ncbi:MAG TPA: LysM domain-containing protein [Candidatus Limnocylindrales bacterium]|nr:LysM domain-containing protein [Candidatus Limnocylindrales bacterium]
MSDSYPGGQLQPPSSGDPGSRSAARSILPWVAGVAIVLVLAVVSGLLTAWLVANMRAAPGPVGGLGSPTPRPSAQVSADPGASGDLPTAQASEPPRRTPTPSPVVTVEPTPFIHVVERGQSVSEIAEIYQVDPQDIIELNELRNANRIQVGQELEIPGYGVIPTPRPRR